MIAEVARLTGPYQLVFDREPLEPIKAGELLCETLVTAISPGTELAAWTGKAPLRPGAAYPRLQGYCNVAKVTESAADGFEVGDRVLSFTSHRNRFVLPAGDVLYRLPVDADAGQIACTYLYHLGYNAVLRSNIRPGSRVLVLGLGALGLASCSLAAIAGGEVFGVSEFARPAALARQMGARDVVKRDQVGSLFDRMDTGADVVIVTTDSWSDWRLAMESAGQNGTIAVLGFPGRADEPGSFNPLASQWFYMKQLRIEAVGASPEQNDSRHFLRFNERANIAWLAKLIDEGRLNPDLLISGRFAGSDLAQAYGSLLGREGSPVTYLLEWAQ